LKKSINQDSKNIATDLKVEDRIQKFPEKKNTFNTFTDHKENFQRKSPCRLSTRQKAKLGKLASNTTIKSTAAFVNTEIN